jgi:hypothetical protein
MTYSIFDTGNLVLSFDRQDAAYEALARLAQASAGSDRLLLVAFDGDGNAIAECVPGERIAHPV